MNIFISMPMNGKSTQQIVLERDRYLQTVRESIGDCDLIDSVHYDYNEVDNSDIKNKPLYYLGESIKKLSEADVCFFADGWWKARGCRVEKACCEEYGIKIIYEKRL